MIRFIIRIDDATMAANVGGAVKTTYETIRMDSPTLERHLKDEQFIQRSLVGIEIEAKESNESDS